MYGFGRAGIGGMVLGGGGNLGGNGRAGSGGGRSSKPRKLTYILQHPEYHAKHVGGVNALTVGPGAEGAGEDQLYTAGRDGTVRAWDLEAGAPTCALTMEGHAGWVNDLAVLRSSVTGARGSSGGGGGNILLSASSDRTVKVWSLDGSNSGDGGGGGGKRGKGEYRSDGTSRVHGAGDGHCVATLERHSDYVMALAAPTEPGATRFASAGLGTDQIFLWDINAVTAPVAAAPGGCGGGGGSGGRRRGKGGGPAGTAEDGSNIGKSTAAMSSVVTDLEGQKESVYALAMDPAGTLLVSGCSQNLVRLWDTRSGERQVKLHGHTGNVRCATIDPTGRLCLTGSSDHTLKLWDLGQQRCVQTLAGIHACSVWSAVPDASWHYVYSGGSDGRVYATDLAHRRSTLLFQESHGVLGLCRDDTRTVGEGVWAATMGSDVRRWLTDIDDDHYLHHHHAGSHRKSVGENAGGSAGAGAGRFGLRGRLEAELAASQGGGGRGGEGESGGMAGSPLHADRNHHPRTSGTWFAAAGSSAPRYGSASGAGAGAGHHRDAPALPAPVHAAAAVTIPGAAPITEHAQLNDRRRVLAKDAAGVLTVWDVTTCTVVKTLPPGPPGADGKEASFAETLQAENTPVSIPSWFQLDARSGSLAVTLTPSSAFSAEAYAIDMSVEGANDETKLNLGVQTVHALLRDWAAARADTVRGGEGDARGGGGGGPVDVNALGPCDDAGVFRAPTRRPLLMCEAPAGAATVLMRSAGLEGTDAEEAALPEWVVDVAAGTYAVPDSPKTSFYLTPSEGMPSLSQGKVMAQPISQTLSLKP